MPESYTSDATHRRISMPNLPRHSDPRHGRAAADRRAAGREPADVGRSDQPRARRRPHGPAAAAAERGRRAGPDDLHKVGTVAIVRQMAKAPNGMRVLVEGIARARATELTSRSRRSCRRSVTAAAGTVGTVDRGRRARPAPAGAGRSGAVARHRPVAGHQGAGREPRRSAAARLSARQPARHARRRTSRSCSKRTACSVKLTACRWRCRARSRSSS